MNFPISTVSLSLLKTVPKPPATNEEELEKLNTLIELQKSKGHKYPLLACVFLLFRTAGKKTLTKSEMYNLMEKKAIEDKTKIVSSPTERYCVITQNNFKSKIKDIVKKKKWFTRAINDKGEIIYTLNDGVVCQISPKIESYLNIIEKRDGIFKNKAREEVVENIEKPKEKIRKRNPKIKKIFKKYTPSNNINNNNMNNIQQNIISNNSINEINKEIKKNDANKPFVVTNNLNSINSINTLNTLNSENTLNNLSSSINANMNMEIEDNKNINNDNNNIIKDNKIENSNNNVIENNDSKNNNNENNINTLNIANNNDNSINNVNANNIEINNNNKNIMDIDTNIISTEKNVNNNNEVENKENINNINNDITTTQIQNKESIIKANSTNTKVVTNNFLIQPTMINSNNAKKKTQSKKTNANNKKKKKINKEKIEEKKIIRQSRSLSNVIEIKDNSDDFDIIIEDEREKNYINNNTNDINEISNNNLTEEARNLNNEIEAILSGKKQINNSLLNNNNTLTKTPQTKKDNKNKKTKKNYIEELSLDYTEENLDESEENKVIDLTNQRRSSINHLRQNITSTPSNKIGINTNNNNKNKNTNKNKISKIANNTKVKHLLKNKRKPTNTLSPFNNKSSVSFYNSNNNKISNNKIKKKRPIVEEKNFESSDNDLYEEKKPTKKKEVKKSNILSTKMSSILSMGELLLNLINKGEISQLMNKKIVYFKQKIEKKEKEIKENKKLIEDLIHSCEKIKSIKNKDILNSINDLKSYYKIFKDKIDILHGYKSALEKTDKSEKNHITEGISNYKQVYIECNQILIKMVHIINTMVKEYGSLDEFVSILCLEEKDNWAKQNIGLNNYDFKKKIKNARNVDDIAQLFKEELDKAKIDVNLFNKYYKTSKNNNNEVIIELNKNIKNNKEKMIRIDDKKVIRINDNINNSKRNKKNNSNDTANKENINLTNDNTSEENNKINKGDKVESVETNYQSIESANNINSLNTNDNNGNLSISIQ